MTYPTILNQGQVVFGPIDLSNLDVCVGLQCSFSDSDDDSDDDLDDDEKDDD